MALIETPVCDFNTPALDFALQDPSKRVYRLADCIGDKGLLVIFMCNHCPYVKAILPYLIEDIRKIIDLGVGCVAIMPNDYTQYPNDAPEHMQRLASEMDFPFPYLIDHNQSVAKAYGAVCTPDFFGFNQDLGLQYRGRFASGKALEVTKDSVHELLLAMQQIAQTGHGPTKQMPSMGCSIKWK